MKPFFSIFYFLFSVLIVLGTLFLLFGLFQYYPWLPTEKDSVLEEVLGYLTGGYIFPASVYASLFILGHYALSKLFKKPFRFRVPLGLALTEIALSIIIRILLYWEVIPPIPWGFY